MRLLIPLAAAALALPILMQDAAAQDAAKKAAPMPKNLKVLAPDTEIGFVMRNFTQALGVQCTYCHVQGDFASDENPKKDIARKMIAMVRQIDKHFPSSAGMFPAGYHEVDCLTCHRGSAKPQTKAPVEFVNRGEALGTTKPVIRPGVNLKVLAPDTRVHGDGSVMHDFRDALNVDCGFCHGGGKPFENDDNIRKGVARGMIQMVREINANFPGTGSFPVGPQAVTCYTCHRAETHPASASNANFGPAK